MNRGATNRPSEIASLILGTNSTLYRSQEPKTLEYPILEVQSDAKILRQTGPVRVLILSEVRLYREGLAFCLAPYSRFHIIGHAERIVDLKGVLARTRPEAILIDLASPDGVATVETIAKISPSIKIIGVAMNEIGHDICVLACAGISSFVSLDGTAEDLAAAIDDALDGKLHCSPRQSALLLRQLAHLRRHEVPAGDERPLTQREIEIIRLVDDGMSNKDIARRLRISVSTVKNHVHSLLEKTRARGRGEAAARFRFGLGHGHPASAGPAIGQRR